MAETILVRHGQASLGAANYDQLSPLGHQQARWLGEHLKQLDSPVDRIIMGSLTRHKETMEGIVEGLGRDVQTEIHEGFNELSSKGLFQELKRRHPERVSETGNLRLDYHNNMHHALTLWMSGEIDSDGSVSWLHFSQNIKNAFEQACDGSAKRTFVVTSGGPISVAVGHVLGLENARILDLMLRIKNSSTTHFLYRDTQVSLDTFNDVGHLNHPDRQQHITFA